MRQIIFFLLFAWAVSVFGSELTPKPTSRNPAIVLPLLRALPSGSTYQEACKILGKPDLDVGSASPNASFKLTDGSDVHITTRLRSKDFKHMIKRIILYSPHHVIKDGEGELLFDATPKN